MPRRVIKPGRGVVLIGEVGSEVCVFLLAVFDPLAGLFVQPDVFLEVGTIKCNGASGLLTSRWLVLHRLQ